MHYANDAYKADRYDHRQTAVHIVGWSQRLINALIYAFTVFA